LKASKAYFVSLRPHITFCSNTMELLVFEPFFDSTRVHATTPHFAPVVAYSWRENRRRMPHLRSRRSYNELTSTDRNRRTVGDERRCRFSRQRGEKLGAIDGRHITLQGR
jgi:hypothetical protein